MCWNIKVKEYFFIYDDELICIVKEMFGSKVYNDIVNVLYSRKILKAYYGFRVLYVFPFPSAGH